MGTASSLIALFALAELWSLALILTLHMQCVKRSLLRFHVNKQFCLDFTFLTTYPQGLQNMLHALHESVYAYMVMFIQHE